MGNRNSLNSIQSFLSKVGVSFSSVSSFPLQANEQRSYRWKKAIFVCISIHKQKD